MVAEELLLRPKLIMALGTSIRSCVWGLEVIEQAS
jgi:hypothetical protein